MKLTAGCRVLYVWMVILMQGSAAGSGQHKHGARESCKLKELTALTKSLVEASLTSFDKSNGKHLGTWFPGFPELEVHENTPLLGPKVQCSLLFMSQGLQNILHDQKSNLNPKVDSLHEILADTISRVNMLAACVKSNLGGECSTKPSPPKMPKYMFERKQWGHTLLKSAREYLDWLQHKVESQQSKVKKIKLKTPKAIYLDYFSGSGHHL